MKIKKKYVNWKSGFIRFKYFEINWNISDWSLPLSISNSVSGKLLFIRFLCVSFIISTDLKSI